MPPLGSRWVARDGRIYTVVASPYSGSRPELVWLYAQGDQRAWSLTLPMLQQSSLKPVVPVVF